MIHAAPVNRNGLHFRILSRLMVLVGEGIEIIQGLLADGGFLPDAVPIRESHPGTARRRIGYMDKTCPNRLAISPEPRDLVCFTKDRKESFHIRSRDRKRAERCIMVFPVTNRAACGEEPVSILFAQSESVHGVSFRTVIRCIERNNLMESRVFPLDAAKNPGKLQDNGHGDHHSV